MGKNLSRYELAAVLAEAADDFLLTVEEAANYTGYTLKSLRARSVSGFPAPVRARGSLRFRLGDIRKWVSCGCPTGGRAK